jgi:hypothetical protein
VLVISSQSYIFYLDPSDKHVQYSEFVINTTGTTMLELLQTVRESIG